MLSRRISLSLSRSSSPGPPPPKIRNFSIVSHHSQHFHDITTINNTHAITNDCGGLTKHLTLACIVTAVGTALPVGYNIGVVNAPAEIIQAWCATSLYNRYNLSLSADQLGILWAVIVSIFLAGGAIGSFVGAWIADHYGRKVSLLVGNILFIMGTIMFITCRALGSVEMLLIGRLLVGLASGLTTSTGPMYLSELAPANLRGPLGTCTSLGICFGIIFGQACSLEEVLGTTNLWHLAFSVPAIFVVVCTVLYPWVPESPVYLYVCKKDKDATRVQLKKLRNYDPKLLEIEMSLLEYEAQQQSERRSIWSVITDSSLRLPLILVCVLSGGQQLSGINAVFFYSVSIFESAGLSSKNAQYANLVAGFINFLTVCLSPYIMARLNRRPTLVWSCLFSGIFLLILTFVVKFIDLVPWLAYVSIAAVFAYIFAFELGLGPVPYFIASELFDSAPRPAAMAIGSVCLWVGNCVTGMLFPILQLAWGAYVFLPFAVVCLTLVAIVQRYLPETREKDAEQIRQKMIGARLPRAMSTDSRSIFYHRVVDRV